MSMSKHDGHCNVYKENTRQTESADFWKACLFLFLKTARFGTQYTMSIPNDHYWSWDRERSSTRTIALNSTRRDNENLFVFGYAAKLFKDDEKAEEQYEGRQLIPWMDNPDILIDRSVKYQYIFLNMLLVM